MGKKVIYFIEDEHKYTDEKDEYTSVSKLWKDQQKPFDGTSISIKKAYKELDSSVYDSVKKEFGYDNPKFIDELQNTSKIDFSHILEMANGFVKGWSEKASIGTAFHKKQEEADIARGSIINPMDGIEYPVIQWEVKDGYENQSCPMDKLPVGYIPEHLVFNEDNKVAGQLDKNFILEDGYFDIDDWKTDAVLEKTSFYNFKTGGYRMLNYPFDHLYDTNYWRYVLKMSTYAYMIEQWGYKLRHLTITHVNIDENLDIVHQERHILPYKKDEVEEMLKIFKNN